MFESFQQQINYHIKEIEQARDLGALEQVRVQLLGKRGLLTNELRKIGNLPVERRADMGQVLHQLKQAVQNSLENRKYQLTRAMLSKTLANERIDFSLPGRGQSLGALHPLTQVRSQIEAFFIQMGFTVKMGPEIEQDTINFTALNIPHNHPARALHDTFYLEGYSGRLLRTHTSTVQIHALMESKPPLRIISIGPVYRRDSDITHTPMFHQLEGMVLDEHSNFMELKGLLIHFLQTFFQNEHLVYRFRASYFPFTEPSAEMDIQCVFCMGKQCSFCSHSGWLEVLGCGMIHPNVLRYSKVNPNIFQGYAFGIGIERLTVLRYLIPDIRLLFENDRRLLSQFK